MTAEPTDGNSLYYYNLWMNARIENEELREELQHEREFSRAGATAFANKEAAYASHGKAQATEVATLRATHARQADTIARLTREHAEVIARLEVMRAEMVGVRAERDTLAAELTITKATLKRTNEMLDKTVATLRIRHHEPCPEALAALCDDCPPAGYPTDKTRCEECPRRTE